MSDLQCPARIFVGWPSSPGDVAAWRAVVAAEGGVGEYDRRGGDPDLAGLADVHRGEAVLVLVDGGSACAVAQPGELVSLEVDSTGARRVSSPNLP